MEDAEPFTSEDNLLSWKSDEAYDSSLLFGTRGMRHVPFCTDGQFIYCYVRHYRERFGEGLVRQTVETYELIDRHFKRIKETELKHVLGKYWRQSKRVIDITEKGTLSCNGETLIWTEYNRIYAFDLDSGIKKAKKYTNQHAITCYDLH